MSHQMILYTDWPSLADYEWKDGPLPPNNSVVYVCMESLYEFFKLVETSNNKYILITGASDYSIVLQDDAPVWRDMAVWMRGFVNLGPNLEYMDVNLPARCDKAKCKITDKYSIKMYSYTGATFNKIPDNILKWYCCNNDLDDKKVVHIPFGLPDWSAKLIEVARPRMHTIHRNIEYYVNFQPNTSERAQLLKENRELIIDKDENGNLKEIPHANYVNRLLHSQFVVSPSGNGLDGFRMSEAISLGCIPIIYARGHGNWCEPYASLGAVIINEKGVLLQKGSAPPFYLQGTPLDLNYWKVIISQDKGTLL